MTDEDNKIQQPGLKHLRTVKMQMMEVSDFAIVNLLQSGAQYRASRTQQTRGADRVRNPVSVQRIDKLEIC